jgi:hypothetical protein
MKAKESTMADSSGGSALPPEGDVAWRLRIGRATTIWDWSLGRPGPQILEPLRRPAFGAASKHVPVRTYVRTVGSHLMLESGLEQDLVRVLDRDPDVTWIVPQPLQLEWGAGRSRRQPRRAESDDGFDARPADFDGGDG